MAAHAYWKLLVNSANSGTGGASFSLAEWSFFDSGGSSISTAGATATGSVAFSGTPANAIDGNNATFYCADGFTFPQFIQVQFGSAVAVDHFTITKTTAAGNGPTDFALQFSDNGSTWTTAFSYKSALWLSSTQTTQTFYTTGIVYRINVTSCGSTSGDGTCAIGDLSFYDSLGTNIPTTGGTPLARGHSEFTGVLTNAFDASGCTTFWDSALADGAPSALSPQWCGYHFPTSVSVTAITITSASSGTYSQHAPLVFTLESSTDGATFTTVAGFTATWSGTCQTQTFGTIVAATVQPMIFLVL